MLARWCRVLSQEVSVLLNLRFALSFLQRLMVRCSLPRSSLSELLLVSLDFLGQLQHLQFPRCSVLFLLLGAGLKMIVVTTLILTFNE